MPYHSQLFQQTERVDSNLRYHDELCPLPVEMLSDINVRTVREYSQ